MGIWKGKNLKEAFRFKSELGLLDLLHKSFTEIDHSTSRRTLETTRWKVFPNVINLEDL